MLVLVLLAGSRLARAAVQNATHIASLDLTMWQSTIWEVQCQPNLPAIAEAESTTRLDAYGQALAGQCLTAQRELEAITQGDPGDELAWVGLGNVRVALGDEVGAATAFGQAQAGRMVLTLGERAATQNKTAEAIQWLRIADRVTPSAKIAFRLASLYVAAGQPDQAMALLNDRLGQTAPDSADYWQLDALLAELQGDWPRAMTAWDSLVQLEPDDYQILMQAKSAAERVQDRTRAVAFTERMITLELGGNHGVWWMLEAARLETERGQYAKAFYWLDRAQAINYQPAWVIDLYRGRTACAAKDLKQGTDYFDRALNLSPDNYQVLSQWGACIYSLTGDAKQAIPYMERAVQQAVGLAGERDLRFRLGDWYAETGNLPAARGQFEAILAQSPMDSAAAQRLKQVGP